MLLEGRSRNINAKPECINIRICPTTNVLVSDNLPVRKSYFDSNIKCKHIATFFSTDYFEADVDRRTCFICDVIKPRKFNTLTLAT